MKKQRLIAATLALLLLSSPIAYSDDAAQRAAAEAAATLAAKQATDAAEGAAVKYVDLSNARGGFIGLGRVRESNDWGE